MPKTKDERADMATSLVLGRVRSRDGLTKSCIPTAKLILPNVLRRLSGSSSELARPPRFAAMTDKKIVRSAISANP